MMWSVYPVRRGRLLYLVEHPLLFCMVEQFILWHVQRLSNIGQGIDGLALIVVPGGLQVGEVFVHPLS